MWIVSVGCVSGHRGDKLDRNKLWALCAYVVSLSSVYGDAANSYTSP